jgi:hypothetical protein
LDPYTYKQINGHLDSRIGYLSSTGNQQSAILYRMLFERHLTLASGVFMQNTPSNPSKHDSNAKPVQPAAKAVSGAQAQKPVSAPPEKPVAPGPKAKSCCG